MTWRHTENVTLPGGPTCRGCFADARHCTTPTPDPASPCGWVDFDGDVCGAPGTADCHQPPCWPPYAPTRCTCGHAIEESR